MRRIAALTILAALTAAPALVRPALAHDVKDPVCRMTVDSDTTKWTHKLGNKSFYFCAQACRDKFAAAPEKYEKLAAQLEKGDLHEYTVDLTTVPEQPAAGQPVRLEFAVRYKEDGKLVPEFELIHERLFHLIMVTEDLRWFEHQHPVRGEDGVFRKTWTFPTPGKYTLYADFTPADGDNQVVPLPLTVGGGPGRSVPLSPDRRMAKHVGDYRVDLQVRGGPLRMEKGAVLTYTLRDRQGRPLRDMQPFIGATGHLLAISQDGKEVVHTHAVHGSREAPTEAGAIHVTPEMATEAGPSFSFKLTVPTGGLYKTWAQFMHRNRVITVHVLRAGPVGEVRAGEGSAGGRGLPGDEEPAGGAPRSPAGERRAGALLLRGLRDTAEAGAREVPEAAAEGPREWARLPGHGRHAEAGAWRGALPVQRAGDGGSVPEVPGAVHASGRKALAKAAGGSGGGDLPGCPVRSPASRSRAPCPHPAGPGA